MPEKKEKPLKKEHVEVLLEDMNKKFDLVLEGHDVLNKKIDDLAAETKERDEKLEFLIYAVDGKVDAVRKELKEEISGVKTELSSKIDKEISGVKKELHETRQELSSKIDKVLEKVENHEVRIIALEEKVLS